MFFRKENRLVKVVVSDIVIGIINTSRPAPCWIEAIFYIKLLSELYLKGAFKIIVQTLLLLYLLARTISSIILKVDVMYWTKNIKVFGVIFVTILRVLLITK